MVASSRSGAHDLMGAASPMTHCVWGAQNIHQPTEHSVGSAKKQTPSFTPTHALLRLKTHARVVCAASRCHPFSAGAGAGIHHTPHLLPTPTTRCSLPLYAHPTPSPPSFARAQNPKCRLLHPVGAHLPCAHCRVTHTMRHPSRDTKKQGRGHPSSRGLGPALQAPLTPTPTPIPAQTAPAGVLTPEQAPR